MKIGIVGTGYVGLVTGSCLAHLGHTVTAVDIDVSKVEMLKKIQVPIFEPGLEELMQPLVGKNLFFSTQYADFSDVDAIFIAVGTPSADDGSADLKYVYTAVESLSLVLKKNACVILKSTVPVGTAGKVRNILLSQGRTDLMVVNNPEFLKEGSAIKDFLEPDRIVVGADKEEAFDILEKIYAPLVKTRNCYLLKMSNVSAELTKYAANCFLATKISFINEIAQLCEIIQADVEDVKKGIGSDPRVGALFLNPGPGYGGSCFPKDVKALIYSAKQVGMDLNVVNAAEEANKRAKYYAAKKLEKILENLKNKVVAIWGLAFKALTDDVRESSAIYVVNELLTKGVSQLQVFDPEATKNFMSYFPRENKIKCFDSQWDCLKNVDALIILTEWNEFKTADLTKLKTMLNDKPVLDMRNLYSLQSVEKVGLRYHSLGRK